MLAVLVSACATASVASPKSYSFDAGSDSALAILVVNTDVVNGSEFFRPLSVSQSDFSGNAREIQIDNAKDILADPLTNALYGVRNQLNAADKERQVILVSAKFASGTYVNVESIRTFGSLNYGGVATLCPNKSAFAYELSAGEIAVIRLDDIRLEYANGGARVIRDLDLVSLSDDEIIKSVEEALQSYPGITGTPKISDPIYVASYQTGGASLLSTRRCSESGPIELIRLTDIGLVVQ